MYQSQIYLCCRYLNTIHYKQIRVQTGQIMLFTVYFHFTEDIPGVTRISLRIGMMSPIVVVDDVSPVVRTGDVDRVRYRGSGVVGIPKTQQSVLFVCCVGDVDGVAEQSSGVTVAGI